MFAPLFTGCATALVTPFTQDGTLDEAALCRLIERQLSAGMDALVLLGTTGEPCTLTMDERARVIAVAMEAAQGRAPVIVGTGANDTRRAIEYARQAYALGAQGQLCVTPYYNKATQDGLVRHFFAIVDACPLPMIIYNVPGRTGMSLTPETAASLSEHPGIVGLKEASGDVSLALRILSATEGHMPLYCGNEDLILPLMAIGAVGAISVVSNVLPAQTLALTRACLSGCMEQARAAQLALLPLIRALFSQVSPIPAKAALSMLGLCEDALRLPLTPMEEPHRSALHGLLRRQGLLHG